MDKHLTYSLLSLFLATVDSYVYMFYYQPFSDTATCLMCTYNDLGV